MNYEPSLRRLADVVAVYELTQAEETMVINHLTRHGHLTNDTHGDACAPKTCLNLALRPILEWRRRSAWLDRMKRR